MQVADTFYWTDTHNLNCFFGMGSQSMPVALRDGVKSYAAGLQDGIDERIKNKPPNIQ
jgi:hypothetical protein